MRRVRELDPGEKTQRKKRHLRGRRGINPPWFTAVAGAARATTAGAGPPGGLSPSVTPEGVVPSSAAGRAPLQLDADVLRGVKDDRQQANGSGSSAALKSQVAATPRWPGLLGRGLASRPGRDAG